MYGTLCLPPIGDPETSANNRTRIQEDILTEKKTIDDDADENRNSDKCIRLLPLTLMNVF